MSEAAIQVRTARQHWAAAGGRHDRLIARLRVILPMATGVLAALLALAPLTNAGDISFVLSKDRVEVAKERMRVTDARYRGADAKGQPFSIDARSAVQATSRDPIVRLQSLAARLQLENGPATVRANSGRYNMESERVAVDGPIRLTAPDGYDVRTRDLTVDLKTRRARSAGPVDGAMPLGTFRADRLVADMEAGTVGLEGGVRLHIVQRQSRGTR